MSKPDWAIERVAALFRVHGPYRTKQYLKFDMARLLKLERARARRAVRQERQQVASLKSNDLKTKFYYAGALEACDDILSRLK